LLSLVLPLVQNLRLGSILLESDSPPDMGSMIASTGFSRLESLISSAVAEGAILHCGGSRLSHPKYPRGHYFTPTLLSNVTPEMAISQTELFAPVFLLMRARTVDEAISIANDTSYALGASVFGDPSHPSTKKCVHCLRAGMVSVNDFGSFYACSMPFGGARGSGYGRFGGEEGLRSLCNIKSICEDWSIAERLGIRTRIPSVLQYPIKNGGRGWQVCKGVIETGYAIGINGRIGGLKKLIGGLLGS
jgi:acyl-CoA reductase-like NAD-dependent aldehyde dehydrogenase